MRAATTCRRSRRPTPARPTTTALRASFLQKMNYLIDTLYDLARKSGRPVTEGGPFERRPDPGPPGPGRAGFDSNLRAGAIRTDYWNWGRGFISAYPPDQFIMLEKGAHLRHPGHPDLGPVLHAAQDPRRPARLLRGGRQPQGARDRPGDGCVGERTAPGPSGRDPHQHVEPLHRRRVRRHERSDGAALPAHARPAVPRVCQALRQRERVLRQRGSRPRARRQRRHHPRQAREPAHPADHRGARDVPRHRGTALLRHRGQLLGHRHERLHVRHRRRGRRAHAEQRRVFHRRARLALGDRASPAAGRTRRAARTTC